MVLAALRHRPGRALHGRRILARSDLGRRVGGIESPLRSMKDDAGLSVLAIGTCCARAGVATATRTMASRTLCIGGLPFDDL